MKVWLDDVRPMPDKYTIHVTTAQEAISLLRTDTVTEISLDHDLGPIDECGTGYDVACFIEQRAVEGHKPPVTTLHTANPVGRQAMALALQSAEKWYLETKRHEEDIDD